MDDDVVDQANNHILEHEVGKKQVFSPEFSELPSCILNSIDRNSPHLIGLWDMQANLLFITHSAINHLGYSKKELLGKRWKRFLSNENRRKIYKCIDEKKPENLLQTAIMNHQGIPIDFKITLKKVKKKKDDSIYFIGFFEGYTHENKVNEIMIESEKVSIASQLAAGIAHEIRNPLTSLKGFLQLLQADVKQKEVYYQIMNEEIDKIEMITSELLYISKPLTDEKKLESVSTMIKDVTILLGSQARMKNISFECFINESLHVYCNRSQIKQVFINLIKNAIEAMDQAGVITIQARLTHQKMLEIDIVDEGPGIPNDIIKKIGEPFFTTKESGTGLGLMITKQILQKQFGRLQILQNDQRGSVFRITFPEP